MHACFSIAGACLGDTLLGMPVSEFLERFNGGRETYPMGSACAGVLKLNQKDPLSSVLAFFSAAWLWVLCDQLPHTLVATARAALTAMPSPMPTNWE